jgi:RNA polymerase sigma factor (sigma-70 family)
MTQIDNETDVLLRQCREAVDRIAERQGWQLLDRAGWAQDVFDLLNSGYGTAPARLAVHIYCRALYKACSGSEGDTRRNQAYAELWHYLYSVARRRYFEIAEDAAQRAAERAYTHFGDCRDPGAFLAFAAHQLLSAARDMRRQGRQAGQPIDDDELAALPDARHSDLDAALLAGELTQRFARLADEFKRKHLRAERQFSALRMKYIDGLDDLTIAKQLGTTIDNVYVLRSRAIEKLREEPEWRALAAEFGILDEG